MVYIIAEAGVDHEGSEDRALELFNAALNAKADCFKIQYYSYGFEGEHRTLPWLTGTAVRVIKDWCDSHDMDFLITPHDKWALDFVCELGLDTIKIGSGDWGLLDAAIATKKELIVSTGGKNIHRIRALDQELSETTHTLLHCVSLYPCPPDKANLTRLHFHYLTGYSDHTRGTAIALAAVGLGAKIIEKHLTLERDVDGRNDTTCSLLPDEWPKFVKDIREIEQALL